MTRRTPRHPATADPVPVGGPRSRSARDPHLTREEIVALLREAPGRIADAASRVPAADLRTAPARGEWSIVDILAHLRACADVWGDPIAVILAEDRPTIRAVSPATRLRGTDYRDQAFDVSFRAFSEQRADLIATLEPLSPEAWDRSAIVTGAGAVLERTLHWYALGLAAHERSHVKQIVRLTGGV